MSELSIAARKAAFGTASSGPTYARRTKGYLDFCKDSSKDPTCSASVSEYFTRLHTAGTAKVSTLRSTFSALQNWMRVSVFFSCKRIFESLLNQIQKGLEFQENAAILAMLNK